MQRSRRNCLKSWLVPCTLATAIAGCGGGDGGGGGGASPPTTFNPIFSEIQANVFTPTCAVSGCHLGAGAPQGLRLDATNSYALLVDVASSEVPSIDRVEPNDPDNSYLIQKLEGTAAVGVQMPNGRPPLSQTVINIIRQWITDGAVDDRTASTNPVRVVSLSPLPDTDLATSPTAVIAMFDRELDVSTVNSMTFIVEGSGGDGTFADGNEMPVTAASITTPAMAPLSATFDLGGAVLADDTYRVRLLGSGASIILDIDANALNGEFAGAFSSGDSIAGGDFEATFTVTTPPNDADSQ